jgi:hypothetical protein
MRVGWSFERAAAGAASGTAATRATVVPADEPAGAPLPDLTGWLAGLRGRVPGWTVPVADAPVKARLGPWDLGEWPGRPLRELDELSWRSDSALTGYAGESLLASSERVRLLLAGWHRGTGRGGAVTHSLVIELAVVQGLRATCGTSGTSRCTRSTTKLHSTRRSGASPPCLAGRLPLPHVPDSAQGTGTPMRARAAIASASPLLELARGGKGLRAGWQRQPGVRRRPAPLVAAR